MLEELQQEKNTNEKAVVRIRIPRRKADEGEDQDKLQEIEIEDRALAVPARFDNVPFSIFVFNEAVPKWHRKEIVNYIKKAFADHFEGKDAQKETESILKAADDMADAIEEQYIAKHCDNETMPCFDFEINLNEND